jgi:hypothetical protein
LTASAAGHWQLELEAWRACKIVGGSSPGPVSRPPQSGSDCLQGRFGSRGWRQGRWGSRPDGFACSLNPGSNVEPASDFRGSKAACCTAAVDPKRISSVPCGASRTRREWMSDAARGRPGRPYPLGAGDLIRVPPSCRGIVGPA